MSSRSTWLAPLLAVAAFNSAAAADDYWNEALKIDRQGQRVVVLPPIPMVPANHLAGAELVPMSPRKPPGKDFWSQGRSVTYILEGPSTLVECVQPFYRDDGTCNPYAPGMHKHGRMRAWNVMREGKWWLCPTPDKAAHGKCVDRTVNWPADRAATALKGQR